MYHFIRRYMQSLALILFFSAGLALTATPTQAQMDIKPGVRAGVDFMTYGGDAEEVSSSTGFLVGAYALVDFGGPIAVQPELTFIQKGASQEQSAAGATVTNDETLNYIELPILAKYQLPVGGPGLSPSVFAGPSIGFNLGGTSETTCSGFDGNEPEDCGTERDLGDLSKDEDGFELSSTDFGIVFGAGVDYGMGAGTVSLDLRYQLGLTNTLSYADAVPDNQQSELTNQGFVITAGFAF